MSTYREALLVTTESGPQWNCCVYDLHTGTTLGVYKSNFRAAANTLCTVHNEYIMYATVDRPMIHVWTLQKKEQVHLKMVVSGKLTALAISPEGHYCVGAVNETLHIWQLGSGNLLTVVTKHYQKINDIKFTDNGSHFVTAGDDNLVHVWDLCSLIGHTGLRTSATAAMDHALEPFHTWNQHSLPVKGVHVGHGGVLARVATASLDRTCKLFELYSGVMLLNMSFDQSLCCVTMDTAELFMYVASTSGQMYTIKLFAEPVVTDRHVSSESETDFTSSWQAHNGPVCSIKSSIDGSLLVTGGQDGHLKVWESLSGQCCRDVNLKGAVNNIHIMPQPPGLTEFDTKITWPLKPFSKVLYTVDNCENGNCIDVLLQEQEMTDLEAYLSELIGDTENPSSQQDTTESCEETDKSDTRNDQQQRPLETKSNKYRRLYDTAIRNILNSS